MSQSNLAHALLSALAVQGLDEGDAFFAEAGARTSTTQHGEAVVTLILSGVLARIGLDTRKVAVERNLEIVPRSTYAATALAAGDPVLDGTRLTQPLAGSASGTVTVLWRVVSSDGHPVSGELSFTVGDGSVAPNGTQTPLPGPPMEAIDMTWIWWVLGAVVVAGGILLVILLTRKRPSRED